ncbi:MAG: hypothetical protein Q7S45_04035 [Candidatus Curtissbacteria bacterium]|nr:hypothetical protein [Candidatus Curtissbacteria bacterium]
MKKNLILNENQRTTAFRPWESIFIIFLFFFSIIISSPFLKPGFYTVHDDQQFARLFEFDKSLRSGQVPPRWVEDLGFGFGYPLFVFYPPLVYFLGEAFHLAGWGYIDSIKLVFFISVFGSAVAMYILTREFWGKLEAFTSSMFYIFAPYRALDIYVRGALAESFSFVWLPLLFWSFYKLQKTQKPVYIIASGSFLALLMLTHNLIFIPFMLILPIFLLFLLWQSKSKKLFLIGSLISFIIAFGASAFFWIPALLEKRFTIVDQLLLVNLADFRMHFVYPEQLWNWPWGFGGSAPGLTDGISFKIGKLHVIVSLLAFSLTILQLVKDKIKSKQSTISSPRETSALIFFALFLFSAFMTTSYSQLIWDFIPPLAYLQFPWRFLTFVILTGSILAGAFIYFLRLEILKIVFSVLLISLLIFPNLKLFKPQTYRENLTDKIVTSKEVINWDVSSSSFEYAPKGVELYKNSRGANVIKIEKSQIPKEKLEILSGVAQINLSKNNPSDLEFDINAKEDTKLKANIFSFPGWQLKIDGNLSPINDDNNLKLITFNIPSGLHHVELAFKNSLVISLANLITLMTLVALVIIIMFRNNQRVKTKLKYVRP